MKNIELIPVFGTSFAVYIPLIMILVALLTLFDGYGRIIKVLGIEWEDSTSLGHDGLSCSCRDTASEAALDPQVQEKIRTGRLVVANELKQRRAAELTEAGGAGRLEAARMDASKNAPTKMRIGAVDKSQIATITEALIPSIPRYRNVDSALDNEVDVELKNPYARPYGGGSREQDAQKDSLFSTFRGGKGGYANVPTGGSGGVVNNPLGGAVRNVQRDLFSIDNDDDGDNIYGGRYSNV
jgi:hypothetical protein